MQEKRNLSYLFIIFMPILSRHNLDDWAVQRSNRRESV